MPNLKSKPDEQSEITSNVNIGNVEGGIQSSKIAGRDIIEVGIQVIQQAGYHLSQTRNLPALLETLRNLLPNLDPVTRATTQVEIDKLNQIITKLPSYEQAYRERIKRAYANQSEKYVELISITDIVEGADEPNFDDFNLDDFDPEKFEPTDEILTITDMPRSDLYEWRLEDQRIKQIKLNSLREAIDKYPCIILLGDPGSGKTTALEHLAYNFATTPEINNISFLPLPLRLSEFYPDVSVEEFIIIGWQGSLKVNHWQAPELAANLEGYLEEGRMLILFDALNEMPINNYRQRAESLREFIDFWSTRGNRFLVTCRVLDYDKELDGLQRVEIQPFNNEQIETYLRKILGKHWSRMWSALTSDANSVYRLLDMARNPFVLRMMVTEFIKRKGRLSRNRAELMESFTEYLWQRAKRNYKPKDWVPVDIQREALAEMAFRMQFNSGSGAVVPTHHVKKIIPFQVQTHPSYPPDQISSPDQLLDVVASANIIEMPPDRSTVRFFHQLLQEYFAAHYMIKQNPENLIALWRIPWLEIETPLWQRPKDNYDPLPPPKATGWEETTILAAGLVMENDYQLLQVLIRVNPVLAGRCLHEGQIKVDSATRSAVIDALVKTISQSEIALRVRIAAGEVLGYLGDPRLGEQVTIIAGTFVMGNKKGSVLARPEHKLFLEEYQIGKYPLTNAEYAGFIEAGGYTEKRWWTDAGWQWKEKEKWLHPRFWNNIRFNKPNQPVVGVSWYEALAFCNWLSAEKGYLHRLPTEAEWEKVARGGEGREYPWGDDFEASRLNAGEGEQQVKATTPVGIYSAGISPFGAFDCAGNVWEWCATKAPGYKVSTYPYDVTQNEWSVDYLEGVDVRLLRGGSWTSLKFDVRCTTRLWNYAERGLDYRGFRVLTDPHIAF